MNAKLGIGTGIAAALLSLWAFIPSNKAEATKTVPGVPAIKEAEVVLPDRNVALATQPDPKPVIAPVTDPLPATAKVETNAIDSGAAKMEPAVSKPIDPPAARSDTGTKPNSGDGSIKSDPPKKKDDGKKPGAGDGTKQPPPKQPAKPPKKNPNPPKPPKQPPGMRKHDKKKPNPPPPNTPPNN